MSTRSAEPRADRPAAPEHVGPGPDAHTTNLSAQGAAGTEMGSERTLRLTVAADAEQVAAGRQAVRRFAEQHRVVRPIDVALAVGEACANVVLHAYTDQPTGVLHVTGAVEGELVCITVADEGSGLSPRLDSPGLGLGLPIIARCSDRFEITERVPTGTRLTMGFAQAPASECEAYAQVRDDLAAALEGGAALDTVEPRIEQAPLSAEARDALWLAAWATADRRRRRRSRSPAPRRSP